MDGIMLCDI